GVRGVSEGSAGRGRGRGAGAPGARHRGARDEGAARGAEKGPAGAGNARVRRGMIHLAWRFLRFQRQSTLALWYRARTADSRIGTRKTMIVALARKLVIALWRFVTTGEPLEGVVLRPAAWKGSPERGLSTIRRSRCFFGGGPDRQSEGAGSRISHMALKCRLEEWARRPELPHGSSPWAESPRRCA